MFGVLPAYGFYIRHADGVTLRNVSARLQGTDARSALVADDVVNLNIDGFAGDATPRQPLLWFNAVRDAFLHESKAAVGVDRFMRLTGGSKVVETGNSLKP